MTFFKIAFQVLFITRNISFKTVIFPRHFIGIEKNNYTLKRLVHITRSEETRDIMFNFRFSVKRTET